MPAGSGQRTRERILKVASKLFYEKGYHGTTLRQIASGANIKAGSIYNHFSGKQELLYQISLTTTESLYRGAVERLEGIEDRAERLEAFILWHVAFHARERLASRVTDEQHQALDPRNRKRVQRWRDVHEQLFRDILDEGVEKDSWAVDDPAVISFAVLTMCTQVDVWYRENGRLTPEEVGRAFCNFIFAGFGIPTPATRSASDRP